MTSYARKFFAWTVLILGIVPQVLSQNAPALDNYKAASLAAEEWEEQMSADPDPLMVSQRLAPEFALTGGRELVQGLGIALARRLSPGDDKKSQDEPPNPKAMEYTVEVLNAIATSCSMDADLIQAQLLYEISTGPADDPAKRFTKSNKSRLLDGPLAERAGYLLDHEDPFVAALAEWAIAVRVLHDNDYAFNGWHGVKDDQRWPPADPEAEVPEWFVKWSSLSPERFLEFDYVRQAYGADAYRNCDELLMAARGVEERVIEALSSSVAEKTQQEVAEAQRVLEEKMTRLEKLRLDSDLPAMRLAFLDLRRVAREQLFDQPQLDLPGIVCADRHSGRKHLVPTSSRASDRAPGGGLIVQHGLDPDSPAEELIGDKLLPGHVQDLDLHWDGRRIVFAHSEQPHWGDKEHNGLDDQGVLWDTGSLPTRLYTINTDGSGFKKLTDHPRYADMEPAWLPDGDVIFASDRSGSSTFCGDWGRNAYFTPPNLYAVDMRSLEIRRVTYNKDEDRYPHVDNDGRVVYMRWDYQERGFSTTQPLWIINPDGTMNDGLYKTHLNDPRTLRDPRPIPGSGKYVAIACGHHEHIEGAVAVIDPAMGINNPDAMKYVTPRCSPTEFGYGPMGPVAQGGVQDYYGLYVTPFALSEEGFLASYAYGSPASCGFALYYIDVFGNKELIRRNLLHEVSAAVPLMERPTPPVIASRVDPEKNHALTYVGNVYNDLPGVQHGEVKYIRILERLQWFDEKEGYGSAVLYKPTANGPSVFSYWAPGATRVIGTVPVEEDGSAYFKAPTNMAVWFQALDEEMREVRRMRTHVEFQPGEVRGCVGCHETRTEAVMPITSLAVMRPPDQPTPPPWGDTEILGFEKHIQPILQKHCVSCHGAEKPEGDLNLTAAKDTYGFMQSYRSLFGVKPGDPTPLGFDRITIDGVTWKRDQEFDKEYYSVRYEEGERHHFLPKGGYIDLPNWNTGTEITEPRQFGSYHSPLIKVLLEEPEHRKIRAQFTPDEWETLVTWVDVNAPYHDTHLHYDEWTKDGPILSRVKVRLDPPFKKGEKGWSIEGPDLVTTP